MKYKRLKIVLIGVCCCLFGCSTPQSITDESDETTSVTESALGELHISPEVYAAGYRARQDSIIDYFANRVSPDDLSSGSFMELAANLYRNQNIDWVEARIDSLVSGTIRGDMFWMYPMTTLMFSARNKVSDESMAKMRDLWRTYAPYRGDTENHWVLYYSTLYLMNEMYPNDPGETWFTGKSSKENREEAKSFLIEWMNLATTIGQGEYDSPHYIKVYLAPMSLLYAFAEDQEMKQRASMMLEYLLADFGVEQIQGFYGGAHSRIYPPELEEPFKQAAPRFSWLLFGNTPSLYSGESFIVALSGYKPPPIIYHMVADRSQPYVHREVKRTRHRIRNSDIKNETVYKYSYVTDDFIIGSSQGGMLQPIQQQTWGIIWRTPHPEGTHNSFTALHPYYNAAEGTMYFAEHWGMVNELITRSKTTYDKQDKLTGGSPYEQVFQHEGAVIAMYDIPATDHYPQINAFFSKDLTSMDEDKSGWIFAQGGNMYLAYYPFQPYQWEMMDSGSKRLESHYGKNGYIVQTAQTSEFASFEAFKTAVKKLPVAVKTSPKPTASFRNLKGVLMEGTYGERPRLNGVSIDYEQWNLFDGPFLFAPRNQKILEIRYGKMRHLLDFNTLTVKDWIAS